MKRFYCTVCQRVKRVRTLPSNLKNENSDKVTLRAGTCARHSSIPVARPVAVKVRKGA